MKWWQVNTSIVKVNLENNLNLYKKTVAHKNPYWTVYVCPTI
jgi:hypothetical protein